MNKSKIFHVFELLLVLSFMDLKVKYRSSALGFFWSFLKPFLQFIIFYIIFAKILSVADGNDYALKLFFSILIWSWFSEATSLGLNAYLGKKSIISKIKTNKLYPPIAAFLTPSMNYALNLVIFFLAYLLFTRHFPAHLLSLQNGMVFLFSLFSISLLIVSLNLMLANLNVLYRDIQPIWDLVLAYGVFITPIIYRIPIPKHYETLYYSLNLLAFPLMNLKSIFFAEQAPLYHNLTLLSCYTFSLFTLFFIAYFVYEKLHQKMVDFL